VIVSRVGGRVGSIPRSSACKGGGIGWDKTDLEVVWSIVSGIKSSIWWFYDLYVVEGIARSCAWRVRWRWSWCALHSLFCTTQLLLLLLQGKGKLSILTCAISAGCGDVLAI